MNDNFTFLIAEKKNQIKLKYWNLYARVYHKYLIKNDFEE